jgi:hypothetical protein
LKQGEKILNLENASRNLIHLPFDYLQKDFEKNFQKILQKQNKWCKRGPKCQNEESNPCIYYENVNWFKFQATFALTLCKLVQFCTYIFALVCVGINHQKGKD